MKKLAYGNFLIVNKICGIFYSYSFNNVQKTKTTKKKPNRDELSIKNTHKVIEIKRNSSNAML
jgi:hypothetical protein